MARVLKWEKRFELDHRGLDGQHKKMVEIIADLQKALISKQKDQIISDLFKDINKYAKDHFAYEDKLFKKHEFPKSEEHNNGHQEFVVKMQEFASLHSRRKEHGVEPIEKQLFAYLITWLQSHILEEDAEFAEYLKKCEADAMGRPA